MGDSALIVRANYSDVWAAGDAYELYVGRWSRLVARDFIGWLGLSEGKRWLDVGCGTGALTQEVLARADPSAVIGVDSSQGFVAHARAHTQDRRAEFQIGDAQELPFAEREFDTAVSGLVLNFVGRPERALAEMKRVLRPGGAVAIYVWDYAGGMQLIRHFWDAAIALDPGAGQLAEAQRFPICNPTSLLSLFRECGFEQTECRVIDVPSVFKNFDDYWLPFLGGQGPAPTYCSALSDDRRATLRDRIKATLPIEPDGSIRLTARAFAVRGLRPAS